MTICRKTSPLIFIAFMLCSMTARAQYVGAITPPEKKLNIESEKLMHNFFTIKCGLFIPSDNNREESTSAADISNGKIAMQNGLFAEVGYGMKIGRKAVGFYCYPLLIAAYMSGFEFKDAINPDLREFTAAEIAQRYGLFYEPTKDLFMAAYYRPAIVAPVGFNSGDFTGALTLENGFARAMTTHTMGFSIQYSLISLSYEYYMGSPLMEIKNNTTDESVNKRVPLRMSIISVAFNF